MLRKLPFNGVTIARADDELNHDQAVPDHDVENVGLVDPQVTTTSTMPSPRIRGSPTLKWGRFSSSSTAKSRRSSPR